MLNNQEFKAPLLIEDLGVMCPTEKSKYKVRYGIYKCGLCGSQFKAMTNNINKRNTTSCGCHKKNAIGKRSITHGLSTHKLYDVWKNIIQRTMNTRNKAFKYYGARGIKVCDRWLDIANFIEDMYPTYQDGLTIDRRDNDGNYEPSNCRWITQSTQLMNTRLIHSNNTSGYRGVCFDKSRNKWLANIQYRNKAISLGRFKTAIEAAKAYDKYVIENKLEHTINGVL